MKRFGAILFAFALPLYGHANTITQVTNFGDLAGAEDIVAFSGSVYVSAIDFDLGLSGLWRIDGSSAAHLAGSSSANFRGEPAIWRNGLWFTGAVESGASGIVRLNRFGRQQVFPPQAFAVQGFAVTDVGAFFTTDTELWQIGTNNRPTRVRTGIPTPVEFLWPGLIAFNGDLYYIGSDTQSGAELRRYDPATNTLTLVDDIANGSADGAVILIGVYNGNLLFVGNDGTTGNELWRLDSAGNVMLVEDINVGPGNGIRDSEENDPSHVNGEFIITEGTLGIAAHGNFYFRADDGSSGNELWRMRDDFTVARVADINTGAGSSDPEHFAVYRGNVYFRATDGNTGIELWRFTPQGQASLVTDLFPGSEGSDPSDPTVNGGSLYFQAEAEELSEQVWRLTAPADPVGSFTAGSGASLLLRNQVDGAWRLFSNIPGLVAQTGLGAYRSLDWQPVTSADFDGDGDVDLLVRHSSGRWRVFEIEAGAVVGSAAIGLFENLGWEFQTAGDFDGDGDVDVILRNQAGAWQLFVIENRQVTSRRSVSMFTGAAWQVRRSGDFDGDGDSDVLLRNQGTSEWRVFEFEGGAVQSQLVPRGLFGGSNWQLVTVADFNDDRVDDVLVRNSNTGEWRIFAMIDLRVQSSSEFNLYTSMLWRFADAADYDGDGDADVLLRHAQTGAWTLFTVEAFRSTANSAVRIWRNTDYIPVRHDP